MHDLIENTQLSIHFNRSEFSCRCGCGFSSPDPELIGVLEQVRTHFNKPLTINSACRCEPHNESVGGASNSAHLQGIAADIVVKGVSPSVVHDYLSTQYPDRYGIGFYNSFTHIDVRKDKARWM